MTPLQTRLLFEQAAQLFISPNREGITKLYHYTSPTGLAGILESKKLFFTNGAYVNDEGELSYPIQLAKKALEASYALAEHRRLKDLLRNATLGVEFQLEWKKWYIASLSTEGSLLSQWRAYCPGGGYSLGFDFEKLQGALRDQGVIQFGPVNYDRQVQLENAGACVRRYTAKWEALQREFHDVPEPEYDGDVFAAMLSELNSQSIFLKAPAFKEEHEWRAAKLNANGESPLFRAGHGFNVPYLELPIHPAGELLPLVEVFVSPLGDTDLAYHSALLLLESKGYPEPSKLLKKPEYRLRTT